MFFKLSKTTDRDFYCLADNTVWGSKYKAAMLRYARISGIIDSPIKLPDEMEVLCRLTNKRFEKFELAKITGTSFSNLMNNFLLKIS
jgi:hypothetical protein